MFMLNSWFIELSAMGRFPAMGGSRDKLHRKENADYRDVLAEKTWSYLRSSAFICGSPKPWSVPAPRCVHSWWT
jgi:hypothetical protein